MHGKNIFVFWRRKGETRASWTSRRERASVGGMAGTGEMKVDGGGRAVC